MNIGMLTLVASGLGAALMYFLDPDRGRRRRALIRDKAVHAETVTEDALGVVSRDLSHRVQGALALMKTPFQSGLVGDEKLLPRIRSRLGRLVSHPSSIEVQVLNGNVAMRGPVLAHEVEGLLAAVRMMRGVRAIDNQLTVHERPGQEPGLQGQSWRPGARWEWQQVNWSPAFRLLTGVVGAGLVLNGMRGRGLLNRGVATAGMLLLARASSNMPLGRFFGVGDGRGGIDIQKTITIDAPPERVYDFWENLENFPRFMSHVRQIRNLGEGKYHWMVGGPAGIGVEWDAVVTKAEPNRLMAWQSMAGAQVDNAGVIHFEEVPEGRTRVHVQMCYLPPYGLIGHSVASLFGFDPKSDMDDDLARMKMIIENEHARSKMLGERAA